ncbi:PREDICTED: gonadotropin-releasing hormone II receptor isoform X1 [Ceratosolen solmsi marchali]|uniref:Gonadotropin-releasing hormone II receptor isoform X1 n=1 Tax=Ceratosolen solmsi marchali TaxID=326594 RepID=A0AAJ6YID6_9HYME|nr:PREDICTED: gonadotropin-releasing hormone II receptor isoform X1 [Ceratosolen solmsi marchali]
MMPLEIGWSVTVSWKGGDVMCRIMSFFRVFGLYLSSFILICISVDRYHAVLRPLQMIDIDRRGRFMIAGSWICSALCSAPQMVVFHVQTHPHVRWYEQCVTFNTFPTCTHELTYSLFGMVVMYLFPLIVIIYTYTSILAEMYRRSKDTTTDRIRRSSLGFLGRARVRTLKMTIIIVLVFFICWTPYYVMSLWYWIDRVTAKKVDLRIQRGLFIFACTNSCMNPIVYGAFNIRKGHKLLSAGRIGVPEDCEPLEQGFGQRNGRSRQLAPEFAEVQWTAARPDGNQPRARWEINALEESSTIKIKN